MASKFTDAQREQALDLVRQGVGYREITRQTGVSRTTISKWAIDAGLDNEKTDQVAAAAEANRVGWHRRRGELIDDLGEVAAELLEKARSATARDAQAFMTAVAIGVDKAQLLSGSATSRHEVLDAQRRRERVGHLRDELAERREAKDGTTGS